MKKVFVFLSVLCVLTGIAAVVPLCANADETDFRYDLCGPNEAMIIDYSGSAATLTLPETLGGYTVTTVAEQAFSGNDTLKSLTVPGTVQYLYSDAIADCWMLEFVLLQDGLKKIGDGAFRYDYSLKRVVIPASVEAIGADVFAECGELTDVFFGGTQEQWDAVGKADAQLPAGVKLHFAAPTEATATETEVTSTETEVTPIETKVTPIETKVTPSEQKEKKTDSRLTVPGDADGDGTVTMKDVLTLRKYLAGMTVSMDMVCADANGDAAVNMKDVLTLRRFLAGLDTAA